MFAGLAIATFSLYLWTLPVTITTYDSGELIIGPASLSIVHPPGYPLYMMLGHLLVVSVPFGPVAFRVNLFSAVCTVVAIVWLARLIRTHDLLLTAPSARAGSAAMAVGVAGMGALLTEVWEQAVTAEVYALNLVMLSAIVWAITRWNADRSRQWMWLASLCLGIGLANHHTLLLVVPGVAWLCWGSTWRGWIAAGLLVGLGLTLYLTLITRSLANPPMDWGNPENWNALWAHALRKQYRPLGGLPRTLPLLWEQLTVLWQFFLAQWSWFGLAAAAGCGVWWTMGRTHPSTRILLMLLALLSLGIVLLTNFRPIPFNINQVQAFFSPALWLTTLASGAAMAWLRDRLREVPPPTLARGAWGRLLPLMTPQTRLVAMMWLITGGLAWSRMPHHTRAHERIVYTYGRDLLDSVPGGHALVVTGDFPTFAVAYLRNVEATRPTVQLFDDEGLVFPFRRVDPALLRAELADTTYCTLGAGVLHNKGFAFAPEGLAYRVTRDAPDTLPTPRSAPALWRRLRFGRPYGQEPAPGTMTRYLLNQYYMFSLAEWELARGNRDTALTRYRKILGDPASGDTVTHTIATLLERRGFLAEAAHAYHVAAMKAPWSALPILGEARSLASTQRLELAEARFHDAIHVEPASGAPYFQYANFLSAQHRAHDAITQYREALKFDAASASIRKNLAAAYLDVNDLQQALQVTTEAMALAPGDYQLYHNFGAIALRLGDLDRAEQAWLHAAKLAPGDASIREGLKMLHAQRKGRPQ